MTRTGSIISVAVVLAALTLADACSKPKPKPQCTVNTDCPLGNVCTDGACVALPCLGMCTSDETCQNSACVSSYGLACSTASPCPTGFTCQSGGTCGKSCTDNTDCTKAGLTICNANTLTCAECAFNSDCTTGVNAANGLNICTMDGQCVGCQTDTDCGEASDMYCSQTTQTCVMGCTTLADCPPGASCTAAAGGVGQCIQCEVASQSTDCISAPDFVCNPANNLCVQCNVDADCTSTTGQCAPNHTCVTCVQNQVCPFGQVCDQTTYQCVDGCSGGSGTPNCAAGSVCDPTTGTMGTCVACLANTDCAAGMVCENTTGMAACVPGCTTDDDCNRGLPMTAPHLYCQPNMGEFGQCVQCVNDTQCGSGQVCDATGNFCRCGMTGEDCTADSDCGYEVIPLPDGGMGFDCFAGGAVCITEVQCGPPGSVPCQGTQECSQIPPVCSQSATGLADQCNPQQGDCPDGFVVEQAADSSGAYTKVCVPVENECNSPFCGN